MLIVLLNVNCFIKTFIRFILKRRDLLVGTVGGGCYGIFQIVLRKSLFRYIDTFITYECVTLPEKAFPKNNLKLPYFLKTSALRMCHLAPFKNAGSNGGNGWWGC